MVVYYTTYPPAGVSLSGVNTWSAPQTFTAAPVLSAGLNALAGTSMIITTGNALILTNNNSDAASIQIKNASAVLKAQWNWTGKIAVYNGINTAATGNGIPTIVAALLQKAETGGDTSALTYTPPAAAGLYRIHMIAQCSAAVAATLGFTATWTDGNGTAQSPTNIESITTNGVGWGLTNTIAAGNTNEWSYIIDIDNSATNIVLKTTFSGTSVAYKLSATIEQLI